MPQADAATAPPESLYFTERGSGPPLLLVHGLMVSGEIFAPVVDQLAANHRVIIPDLRGHRRSRALPPPYTARQLAADLSALLQRLGVASAAVLGYSQGGAIAQQLALDSPAQCNRLILACTYAFNMASPREQFEGHVTPLLLRVLGPRRLAQLVVSQGAKELDKARAAWLVNLMANQDRRLMVAAWKETMAFDSRKRLAEIMCPTLIIAGADDRAVPIHHARMLHDGIQGSQLTLIAGAGHTWIWTHPDELVRVTEEFLRANTSCERGDLMTTSSGAVRVIQATSEHLEALAALFDGYRQFYGESSDLDGARAFLAQRIDRGESVLFLALLDQDGREIPAGLAQLYPSFSSTSMQRLWILNDLYVAPAARKRGAGRALLLAAREHAERTGAKGLELMTARDNYAAQALYESMGWQRDEVFLPYTLYFSEG